LNIKAKEWDRITVTKESKSRGLKYDANTARYTQIGREYTVDRVYKLGYLYVVRIKEFPDITFRVIQFEDLIQFYSLN
jgi:hypothetical protein